MKKQHAYFFSAILTSYIFCTSLGFCAGAASEPERKSTIAGEAHSTSMEGKVVYHVPLPGQLKFVTPEAEMSDIHATTDEGELFLSVSPISTKRDLLSARLMSVMIHHDKSNEISLIYHPTSLPGSANILSMIGAISAKKCTLRGGEKEFFEDMGNITSLDTRNMDPKDILIECEK